MWLLLFWKVFEVMNTKSKHRRDQGSFSKKKCCKCGFAIKLQANLNDPKSNLEMEFAMIGLHSHPKNAPEEIDKLDDVRKWTRKK